MTGDWDTAGAELAQAADADGLAGTISWPAFGAGWRRCAATPPPPRRPWLGWEAYGPAKTPRTRPYRVVEAFTAAARGQPPERCATPAALDHAAALGISHEALRWAWPLAARAAHDLGETATVADCWRCWTPTGPGTSPR